jgi:hypothetical protein
MKTLTDQQKLEILCAYLPHRVEFKLPIDADRFDSITEGEPWRLGMAIEDAVKENIYNASRYEIMTLKQTNPSIMWDDGEILLGQMISSLGFEEDDVYLNEVKLILRHPDDMTEEELQHLANNWGAEFGKSILANETPMYLSHAIDCLHYLHSLHIDTFGAIEAGFAVRKNINEKG